MNGRDVAILRLLSAALLSAAMPVLAGTAAEPVATPPVDSGWSGRADLGFYSQNGSGGSNARLSFKTDFNRQWGDFALENHVSVLNTRDDTAGNGTARYLLRSKQKWSLDQDDYVYVQEQYEKDSTSEFDYQAGLTTGLGRTFIKDDLQSLIAELGAGLRHSVRDVGPDETVPIATGGLDYRYRISPSASLRERAGFESGRDSTILRSFSELNFQLREALGLGLGYDIRREYSDTREYQNVTTVNLTYTY